MNEFVESRKNGGMAEINEQKNRTRLRDADDVNRFIVAHTLLFNRMRVTYKMNARDNYDGIL